MSENVEKRPQLRYEPGELEKTRKNIGSIKQEDALKMMKILGGEVGIEKSAPVDISNIPKKAPSYSHRNGKSTGTSTAPSASSLSTGSAFGNTSEESEAASSENLPRLSAKDQAAIDKLMMSPAYKIKQNYGIFMFLYKLFAGNVERVAEPFFIYSISDDIAHMNAFSASVRQLVSFANAEYKEKIQEASTVSTRVVKSILEWNIDSIQKEYNKIQQRRTPSVQSLIPIVRLFYRHLLPLFYLGENRVADVLTSTYTEIAEKSATAAASRESLLKFTREAANEWLVLYGQVIKELYPLLMRMCSSDFTTYPDFFYSRISKILPFLHMTKYDIILPEKKSDTEKTHEEDEKAAKAAEEEALAKKKEQDENQGQSGEIKKRPEKIALEMLELLFPLAGWQTIEDFPDLYPYFQPLYQFQDGFNLLSPKNPLMLTVVLIRIIEDLFQGCRNIKFSTNAILELQNETDSLNDIFADWSIYREVLFEKKFCASLKDYVNHLTTQSDFYKSKYGRKEMTDILWQEKYDFLPNMIFDIDFVGKPYKDMTYKPLHCRVAYLQKVFAYYVKNIDSFAVTGSKNAIPGVSNIWEPYRFEMPNNISRRLDVLLSSKTSGKATNANLVKITLNVINLLDWLLNDSGNPFIADKINFVYRTVDGDNYAPAFSIQVRNDQNKLFIKNAKQASTEFAELLGMAQKDKAEKEDATMDPDNSIGSL